MWKFVEELEGLYTKHPPTRPNLCMGATSTSTSSFPIVSSNHRNSRELDDLARSKECYIWLAYTSSYPYQEKLTLRKQSVRISMVQVLRRRKTANKVVSIASIVARTLNLAQMRHLMQDSVRLCLRMTSTAGSRKRAEEARAVDHLRGGWGRVCEDTTGAGAKDVRAVLGGCAAGGGTAFGSDVVEDGAYGGRDARGRAFEVLGKFGGVGRRRRSCARERSAVGECVYSGGASCASAVGLENSALGEIDPVAADLAGLYAIDGGDDFVAGEGHGTGDGGRVEVCVGECALGEEVKVTTGAHVMGYGDIECGFDTFACLENLESGFLEVGSAHAETDALESNRCAGFEDLNLLNVRVVKEGTGLEELQILGAGVLDGGLHFSVAGELKRDIERRVALVEA
jgi:hypothetical protein